MTIKAVVFDAYGTLYDIQSVAEITEDFGLEQLERHLAGKCRTDVA